MTHSMYWYSIYDLFFPSTSAFSLGQSTPTPRRRVRPCPRCTSPPPFPASAGMFERSDAEENHRSLSPVRAGKRARPLSPLQPLASSTSSSLSHLPLPHSSSADGGRGGRLLGDGSFGFSHHQHPHVRQQQAADRERAEGAEVVTLRREVSNNPPLPGVEQGAKYFTYLYRY